MASIKVIRKGHIVKFVYGKKRVEIDLSKEWEITETTINSHLCNQSANYAFLSMVKNEYCSKRDEAEKEKDEAFSKAYISYKESNPRITNELATHKANSSAKYQLAYEKYIKAKKNADDLISLCRAYEMKAQMMQTVSSNLRKEQ